MISKNGNILSSIDEKIAKSKRYIQTLFNDNRNVSLDIKLEDGLDITREEGDIP